MYRGFLLILLVLSTQSVSYSQSPDNKKFNQEQKFYITGDAVTIGNNTVSRHKDQSYNILSGINDRMKMTYVDIDNDPATFSSSSAAVSIPDDSKIIHATLYWSGTYPGAVGKTKISQGTVYYETEGEKTDYRNIKVATDWYNYTDITGELIYDAVNTTNEQLRLTMPYVCKADITDLFDGSNKNIEVTVANIASAQGKINGGSTAGWILYLVFENSNLSPKYITLYDGFEAVLDDDVTIEIDDFQSVEESNTNTFITIAALDGDRPLQQDATMISNPKNGIEKLLNRKSRPEDNFFNSSISPLYNYTSSRKPYSRNTLGFDIAHIKINDPNNYLFPLGTNKINLTYSTKEDGYYVFFTAFKTEINQEFLLEKKVAVYEEAAVISNTETIEKPIDKLPSTNITEEINKKNQEIDENAIKEESIIEPSVPLQVTNTITQATESTIEPGYYLITNVFSDHKNVINWKQKLLEHGYQPSFFIHPDSGLTYVYIAYDSSSFMLRDVLVMARKNTLLKEAWIKKME